MAAPRLTGAALRATRMLTSRPALVRLLWPVLSKDFHFDELAALPDALRGPVPPGHLPVMARPPRRFGSSGAPVAHAEAGRIRRAYASGERTPSAVLARLLARLDQGGFGHVGHSPFVALDAERATADARASDARWHAGAPLSPLDGMPVPVKDELSLIGAVTRGGTSYRRDVDTEDAAVITALRGAGAIVVGKTHATEWGMNPLGQNASFAMPRNAWRAGYGAGGSSTGSGAAVALGLCPAAVGSDGGGSIRIPAAMNGVYGLKPTWVRCSRVGNLWGGGSMAHLGPLGASATDLAELLSVTGNADPADPWTCLAPSAASDPASWCAAPARGVRGARVGVLVDEIAAAPAPMAALIRRALQSLEAAGAVLIDVRLALSEHAPAIGALTIAAETLAGTSADRRDHGAALNDDLAITFALLQQVSAGDLLDAARLRVGMRRELAAVFADIDLLALPTTTPAVPYPLTEDGVAILDAAATAAATRFAFLANLTGLPAGTAPIGVVDGLPVGLQLIGDAWDEASVLAGLAHLERSGLWESPRCEGWFDLLGAG